MFFLQIMTPLISKLPYHVIFHAYLGSTVMSKNAEKTVSNGIFCKMYLYQSVFGFYISCKFTFASFHVLFLRRTISKSLHFKDKYVLGDDVISANEVLGPIFTIT